MAELLSVIVPIYRADRFLDRCISSIVSQTYDNLEIILVDDGSDDGSLEICERWGALDDRIVLVRNIKNEGLVSARKRGLAVSTAEYIGYVDADDWIDPDFYEHLMFKRAEYDCDIVLSGRIEEYIDRRVVCPNRIPKGLYEGDSLKSAIRTMICNERGERFCVFPTVWDKVFKREILEKYQNAVPENITIGEDVAVSYPAIANAKRIYISEECKYHYNRTNESSMLFSMDRLYFDRLFSLKEYLESVFKDCGIYDEIKKGLDEYIFQQAYDGIELAYGVKKQYLSASFRLVSKYVFPYELVEKGSNIILYGAGIIGGQYIEQIEVTAHCNVIAWIDRTFTIEDDSLIKHIEKNEYDSIVIAVKDPKIKDQIVHDLIEQGANRDKIVWKIEKREVDVMEKYYQTPRVVFS